MVIAFTPTDQPQRVSRPDAQELLVPGESSGKNKQVHAFFPRFVDESEVLLEVDTDVCFSRLYARWVSF
jgi:hypothetical protein